MKRFCLGGVLFIALAYTACAQRIVVDSSFSNNYLRKPTETIRPNTQAEPELDSFTDLVAKIGDGIWTRLKYRLNLEGIQESIENKKEKYTARKEDEKEG